MVLILHPFGVYSVFYSNLIIFLSFYIVSYIVTSFYFFNMSSLYYCFITNRIYYFIFYLD